MKRAARGPQARPADAILYRALDLHPSKGDLRKLEIIEAAIHCLATVGISATSLDAIGRVLKIKSAHIIYHFKDKDALLEATVKYVIALASDLFIERITAGSSPEEQLEGYLDAVFEGVERYPEHARVMLLFYYYSSINEEYRAFQTLVREGGAKRIEAIITPLRKGRSRFDAGEIARLIYCALTGYTVEYLATRSRKSLEEWRTEAGRTVAGIIASL